MTLIEGVGDEVTDFFIVVVVLLVGWLAWCSTSIIDQPFRRTVLILQSRTVLRLDDLRPIHQNASSFNRRPNSEASVEESAEPAADDRNDNSQSCPESSVADAAGGISSEIHRAPEATATEEVLIRAMDSFSSDNTMSLQSQSRIDSSKETSITACPDAVDCGPESLSISGADEISIKLKFINDDQKVVAGGLQELLGDFKRRHFQLELEAQKLVRLVFKGRVLQPDSQTLERCGLYNNCVVHCLVHQPQPSTVPSQAAALENSSLINFNPQTYSDIPAGTGISSAHNEWDLSRLLVSILTLTLGIAWYSRYHYAQLFTATTTLALCALTAIFTVSLFSNFFPDQENIRNIE